MTCARCDLLARQLAEARDELDAWRGNARDDRRTDTAMQRLAHWCACLNCSAANALTLMLLVDQAGRIITREAILTATRVAPSADPDLDASRAFQNVRICLARRVLVKAKVPALIESVWGQGYRMPEHDAAVLKAFVGEAA